jgi:hypothetical protein
MDIGFVQELYKVEAARSRGEQISEFKIARLYVDSMWIEMTEMLESGIPKSDLVGMLMITARVGRAAAYNTLTNKINSATKRKAKSEVSKKVGEVKPKPASTSVAPALKPVQPTAVPVAPPSSPSPAVPVSENSAPAQSDQQPNSDDKWAHLRGNNIIVGKGFLGEEERWMTPEEIQQDKERRAAIEKSSILAAELSKRTKK